MQHLAPRTMQHLPRTMQHLPPISGFYRVCANPTPTSNNATPYLEQCNTCIEQCLEQCNTCFEQCLEQCNTCYEQGSNTATPSASKNRTKCKDNFETSLRSCTRPNAGRHRVQERNFSNLVNARVTDRDRTRPKETDRGRLRGGRRRRGRPGVPG